MSDVEREIDAMKAVLGVELDRDLADGLKIDPSAVAAWRRRGRVPDKYKVRYKIKFIDHSSAEPTGIHADLRDIYIFSLIATASTLISENGYNLASSPEIFEQALIAQKLRRFYSYLIINFPHGNTKIMLGEVYEGLRAGMLAADDIIEWLDARPATGL